MSLPDELQKFLKNPINNVYLYDKGNIPFVSFTFIDGDTNIEIQELSFSRYLKIICKDKTTHFPSTHGITGCIGLSKIIQGTYLDALSRSSDDPEAIHTDYGHCDMIRINEHLFVIISVIASPQDSLYFFTYIKNQVEILNLNYP